MGVGSMPFQLAPASAMARTRSRNKKHAANVSGYEIGALLFPGPEEILNDVVLDQMMVDG